MTQTAKQQRIEVLKDLLEENQIIKSIPNIYGSHYDAKPIFSYKPDLKDKMRMEERVTPSGIKYTFARFEIIIN